MQEIINNLLLILHELITQKFNQSYMKTFMTINKSHKTPINTLTDELLKTSQAKSNKALVIFIINKDMENNGKGKEGTSKNGSVFPKKDKKSVKAMAVEKIVKATTSSFKNDKKKINPSD